MRLKLIKTLKAHEKCGNRRQSVTYFANEEYDDTNSPIPEPVLEEFEAGSGIVIDVTPKAPEPEPVEEEIVAVPLEHVQVAVPEKKVPVRKKKLTR